MKTYKVILNEEQLEWLRENLANSIDELLDYIEVTSRATEVAKEDLAKRISNPSGWNLDLYQGRVQQAEDSYQASTEMNKALSYPIVAEEIP